MIPDQGGKKALDPGSATLGYKSTGIVLFCSLSSRQCLPWFGRRRYPGGRQQQQQQLQQAPPSSGRQTSLQQPLTEIEDILRSSSARWEGTIVNKIYSGTVLRIRDTDSYPSRISDSTTATKEKGEKLVVLRHLFLQPQKYHKIENYFSFEVVTKKIWFNLVVELQ
jgi:hypothetical protein